MNSRITGQTKYPPDRQFGLAKKAYKAADDIDTFNNTLEIIKESAKIKQ
jgi:hypothetical protein